LGRWHLASLKTALKFDAQLAVFIAVQKSEFILEIAVEDMFGLE
jgi:hypothetical protein